MSELEKIKKCFSELQFVEESHKYYFEGVELETSASRVIELFAEQPNWDVIAKKIDDSKMLPYGTTRREWKNKGKEAAQKGNKVHKFAEDYAFDRSLRPTIGQEIAVVKFWDDLGFDIEEIGCEIKMLDKKLLFGGTFDLFIRVNGKNYLIDYKTNKNIFKNYRGRKLFPPFENMLDNPLSKFSIQLSLYENMLSQAGVKIHERAVVWLKPNGVYETYSTPDLSDEIEIAKQMIPYL